MKTLNIAILIVLIGVFTILCIQNVYAIPNLSPQDLYKQSYIVLYGKVIAKDSGGSNHYNYQIKAEQYFKNPQTSDSITVIGQIGNETHLAYPQFEVGDMAIFYVDKIQGIYVISPYSTKAGDACDIHAFLGPKPILGEPVMRGPPNPLVLTDENGGRVGMIPADHPVIIKYALANDYPSSKNYTMDILVQKENDTVVFHKTQTIEVSACGYSEDALKWNFIPTQSGNFTVNAILNGTLIASATLEVNKTNLSSDANSVSMASPLKQFKSRIAAKDVKCKQGLELMIKLHDNMPACVKSTSTERLLGQGWVNPHNFNGAYLGKETFSSDSQKFNEFDGVIIDQSLDVTHEYYFFTNGTSVKFTTGSSGIRLDGINNIDYLNGKHAKIFGTVLQNGEDYIEVKKFLILYSLIPKGTPSENMIQKVSFDDLYNNPDKYYNQTITITGELREYDNPLGIAGVGCYSANYTTSDGFIPDFISRHQLYDGSRYLGIRIGGQDDVGYSESERLPSNLKNKQVTVIGILVPSIKDTGYCMHEIHKSGYILTDFKQIKAVQN